MGKGLERPEGVRCKGGAGVGRAGGLLKKEADGFSLSSSS